MNEEIMVDDKKDEKKRNLQSVIKELNRNVKKRREKLGIESKGDATFIASENKDFGVFERIPSGIAAFDDVTGGGIPLGLISQIFGPEAGGKSTILYNIIREAQKRGLSCGLIDAEHRADRSWLIKQGVDPDNLAIAKPMYAEEAFQMAGTFLKSSAVDLLAYDSVMGAATLDQKTNTEGEWKQIIAQMARKLSEWLPAWNPVIGSNKVAMLFINQVRADIGSYGDPIQAPGGNALKHFCSLTVKVRKGSISSMPRFKKDGQQIGFPMVCKVSKTSIGNPFMEASSDFYFGRGFDPVMDLFNQAVAKSLLIGRAGTYYLGEEKLPVRGLDNIIEYLRSNEAICDKIKAKLSGGETDSEHSMEEMPEL